MSRGRWMLARRAVQAAVALFYLVLPLLGLEQLAGTLVALRVGRADLLEPAAILSAVLAARTLTAVMLLGVLPVVLAAVGLGSVYCGWLCPYGLLSEGIDRLRNRGRSWPDRAWEAMRRPRTAALATVLVLSILLAAPLGAILSPPRLITALPLEAWAGRTVPWVTAGLLLGFLAIELLGPRRIVCRALCPAGAIAAWLRTRRTWRPRFDAERCCCPAAPECQDVCAWGLDPRSMGTFDGCTSCMACVEKCPGDALTVRVQATPSPR